MKLLINDLNEARAGKAPVEFVPAVFKTLSIIPRFTDRYLLSFIISFDLYDVAAIIT
jgi:hypothetical protein